MGEEPQSLPGIIQESRGEILTRLTGTGDSKSLEIVKSIVYGGLMEFITSLSIVTSAAASGATTRKFSLHSTTFLHCLLLT